MSWKFTINTISKHVSFWYLRILKTKNKSKQNKEQTSLDFSKQNKEQTSLDFSKQNKEQTSLDFSAKWGKQTKTNYGRRRWGGVRAELFSGLKVEHSAIQLVQNKVLSEICSQVIRLQSSYFDCSFSSLFLHPLRSEWVDKQNYFYPFNHFIPSTKHPKKTHTYNYSQEFTKTYQKESVDNANINVNISGM